MLIESMPSTSSLLFNACPPSILTVLCLCLCLFLEKDEVLTWERRVKILRDCAMALRYLHNYIDGCIVHRDIKVTNVMIVTLISSKLAFVVFLCPSK